jgi:recombinational DNA repair protein (RecF pathway)
VTALESLTSTAVLSSPGGPLHEAPATHCAGCRRPIPEHGYHVIDEDVYCQSCGALAAVETLVDSDPLRPLDAVETQALDILRTFVREQEMREP